MLTENLARTGERVTLAVDEALDFDGDLDVAFAIEALAGAAFVGLELRELRLPEAQDIWLDFEKARDVPDLEIQTIRDRGNFNGALRGWMRCHNKGQLTALLVEV